MPSQQLIEYSRLPFFLVVIVVIVGFLSYPIQGYALSCLPRKVKFVTTCQKGQCENGFVIERVRTGESCNTRPAVREQIEDLTAKEAFAEALIYSAQEITSGIYELDIHQDSSCLRTMKYPESWNAIKELDFCKTTMEIIKLSDNTDKNAIERYKDEWQIKEQEGLRAVTVEKWRVAIITIAIVFIAITWPWILLLAFRALRRHILLLILFSIVIQIWIAIDLLGRFMWAYSLLRDISDVSVILLYITSFTSASYVIGSLIYRKFRKI